MKSIETTIPPVHKAINKKVYIFPIHGMDMNQIRELTIGNVTFMDKKTAKGSYSNSKFNFNVESYALVDLSTQDFKLKYENGLNSVALKLLKETIGFMNISLYSRLKLAQERKITITNINEHLVEEGLVKYIIVSDDDTINVGNSRFDKVNLTMNTSEIQSLKGMHKNWMELLEQDFEGRTELHKKIFKALEYLYYISNEIYATERIIKYFIILNNIFKVEGDNLKRTGSCNT